MVKTANPALGFQFDNYVTIRLTDKGSPGVADMVNFDPGKPSQDQVSCAGVGDLAISQGNYVVHDQPVTDLAGLDALNLFLAQIESHANDPYG